MEVEGVKRYTSKGIAYCYDRASGTRILAAFGTTDFFTELEAVRKTEEPSRMPKGSLGEVIRLYKKVGDWSSLKPKTQLSYNRVFAILDPLRRVRMSQMTRPQILKMRDDDFKPKHGRWMANYAVTVMALLFSFALDRGEVTHNPLEKRVKRIRKAASDPVANRPWVPEECRMVLDEAPAQLLVPLALAMFSGLRKADVLAVTLADIENGEITIRTSKRGVPVKIPMHPKLIEAIELRPTKPAGGRTAEKWKPAIQIAITSRGAPWTETGFNASWNKFKLKLEAEAKVKPGLTIHGLRHTLGTRLKEVGVDDGTIADILGQRSTSMARHYSESADLPDAAKAVVVGLDVTKKRGKSG
ncbi:MAG: tyrosine-type recombinase/integrase [Methylocella sp.]